jgi:hypothetical protein
MARELSDEALLEQLERLLTHRARGGQQDLDGLIAAKDLGPADAARLRELAAGSPAGDQEACFVTAERERSSA